MNILMSYRSGYNSSFTATTEKERETEFRLYMWKAYTTFKSLGVSTIFLTQPLNQQGGIQIHIKYFYFK